MAKSANGTGGRGSKRTKVADTAAAAEGLSMTADYRHDSAKRKNLPGAAMAGEDEVPRKGRVRYA